MRGDERRGKAVLDEMRGEARTRRDESRGTLCILDEMRGDERRARTR
jgi:hypothetical protein